MGNSQSPFAMSVESIFHNIHNRAPTILLVLWFAEFLELTNDSKHKFIYMLTHSFTEWLQPSVFDLQPATMPAFWTTFQSAVPTARPTETSASWNLSPACESTLWMNIIQLYSSNILIIAKDWHMQIGDVSIWLGFHKGEHFWSGH